MAREDITPTPILQLVTGLWAAGVLKGGLELQVFDHLSAMPQDADSLSRIENWLRSSMTKIRLGFKSW
jgi:hypothetical protein